jgi:hypothetical protein
VVWQSGDHNESRERAIYEDPDVQRIFVEVGEGHIGFGSHWLNGRWVHADPRVPSAVSRALTYTIQLLCRRAEVTCARRASFSCSKSRVYR